MGRVEKYQGTKNISGCHRPPNGSGGVGNGMKREIRDGFNKGISVIMGDFNLHIDWTNQISHNAGEEEFLECLRDGFLDQCVEEPTREQAILDWVLCNEKGIIANLALRDPLGMSDHNMIEFIIKMKSEVFDLETQVLNLNQGNYEDTRRELALIDWGELLKGMTVDRQWQTFKEHMGELQQLFIPVWQKSKGGKRANPWLTKEIRNSIRYKEEADRLAKKNHRSEDWEQFRMQQRRTKGLIKKGKVQYERQLAGNIKTDTKSFNRYVKRKRLVKRNVGPPQTETGECIIRDKDMAEKLNTNFGSVFTKEDTNQIPEMLENERFSERRTEGDQH
ncbi:ORM1-like protein 2 isoform X1 [Scyliorhinus torazame]|uniref:ORM1-like protein 2 isoform X1 n=1 Tax=Scyliorhinus torazame TaxID=75743 RepID=UPI003B59401D